MFQFAQQLVHKFNFHHFDNPRRRRSANTDPRLRRSAVQAARVVNLLFAAHNGDLTALKR